MRVRGLVLGLGSRSGFGLGTVRPPSLDTHPPLAHKGVVEACWVPQCPKATCQYSACRAKLRVKCQAFSVSSWGSQRPESTLHIVLGKAGRAGIWQELWEGVDCIPESLADGCDLVCRDQWENAPSLILKLDCRWRRRRGLNCRLMSRNGTYSLARGLTSRCTLRGITSCRSLTGRVWRGGILRDCIWRSIERGGAQGHGGAFRYHRRQCRCG